MGILFAFKKSAFQNLVPHEIISIPFSIAVDKIYKEFTLAKQSNASVLFDYSFVSDPKLFKVKRNIFAVFCNSIRKIAKDHVNTPARNVFHQLKAITLFYVVTYHDLKFFPLAKF